MYKEVHSFKYALLISKVANLIKNKLWIYLLDLICSYLVVDL